MNDPEFNAINTGSRFRLNHQNDVEFFESDEYQTGDNNQTLDERREIQVSVEFLRFGEIDTMNEKYYAEVCIESTWFEKKIIKFYDPKVDWNPKLYIENSLLEPKEEIVYEVKRLNDLVAIKEIKYIKGYFWEKLELENFPLDIQELSIVLASKLKYTQLEFKTDPNKPSAINYKASKIFVDQQKWYLYRFVKVCDYASYDLPNNQNDINIDHMKPKEQTTVQMLHPQQNCTDPIVAQLLNGPKDFFELKWARNNQSKFVASCYCARRAGYYMFNAYFIIFLTTALSLTIFSINCKNPHARLQTNFTLVLTSASFKWVINRSLPTISYMTSLDKYAIVSIFFLCLLCIWHAIVGTFWVEATAIKIDIVMFAVFNLVFFIIHMVLLIWLFRAYKTIRDFEKINQNFIRGRKSSSFLIMRST